MLYIAITFPNIQSHTSAIVIALLSDAGYEGFEESEDALSCFIKKQDFDEAYVKEIATQFNLTYTMAEVPQQNWNAQWESSFEPVVVDDFAAVRASFHTAVKGVQHEIIITPKMSFGTGHHATTFLMMQQMQQIDFVGKSVFDFGTGTGVLAILAEKIGAAKVYAIDNDEWSIENTKENISANACTKTFVEQADEIDILTKYDVILANINLNVLTHQMQNIATICNKGAIVLFSGILLADEAVLTQSANKSGIRVKKVSEKSGWLCITAEF
jgi:ribosomal protein L11 methyltransferase